MNPFTFTSPRTSARSRRIKERSLGSDLIGSAYGARLKQKSRRVAMQGRQNVGQKPSYGSKAS